MDQRLLEASVAVMDHQGFIVVAVRGLRRYKVGELLNDVQFDPQTGDSCA